VLRAALVFLLSWALVWIAAGVLVGLAAAHGLAGLAVIPLLVLVVAVSRIGAFTRGGRFRGLAELARRLEATDERRRTFLADLAHELRTPLAVVRAQAEAISEGVYPADAAHLGPILDAAAAMEALTADLRTLAESDAGALTLKLEPIAVDDLLSDTVSTHAAQAAAAGIELEASPGAGTVNADAARLRRVLANLVTNALAHTPAGGTIRLAAERRGSRFEITVSDSGSGLEPGLGDRAFERFSKGPGSRGSGLGLAIAKDIVEAHGGTIALETNPGGGTTVRLALPGG
jgi:two-component system sensor histidine kinase BaeS